MTQEAQAARALFDNALKTHLAVQALGISDEQLAETLKLGKAVADFVAPARRAGAILLPQFEKVLDGGKHIITRDLANGLEWDIAAFDGREFRFDPAVKACADLRTGGYADWRLPTRKELDTIVDLERYNPAIDPEFFPNTKSGYYRSSTKYAPYSGYRWGVGFDYGNSSDLRDGGSYFVRAVRASQ